jgi:tRNA(adenine34) deaminase
VRASNRTVRDQDPTAHAELLAIREAARLLGRWRLDDCTLVVTLEPCAMCAGAIVLSRLGRLVFGAWDDKAGMVGSVGDIARHPRLNHRPEVLAGVLSDECGGVLAEFFRERRE